MNTTLKNITLDYLQSHTVLTLATSGPEGLWAAAVFYVNADFTFYFLSAPTSRHSRNIAANPHVAGTIQENYTNWPDIKGIQFEGECAAIADDEQTAVINLYGTKFPIISNLEQTPPEIVKAMSKITWYKIVPTRLYFIDNSKGFGHRDEVQL